MIETGVIVPFLPFKFETFGDFGLFVVPWFIDDLPFDVNHNDDKDVEDGDKKGKDEQRFFFPL